MLIRPYLQLGQTRYFRVAYHFSVDARLTAAF